MKTELEKILDAFHTGNYVHLLDYVNFKTYTNKEVQTIIFK